MNWEPEALARLERVPFFVRKRVKKQIENFVHTEGKNIVTAEDVAAARQQLMGDLPLTTSQGELSAEALAKLKEAVDKKTVSEELDTSHIKFRLCGGAAGCPLALYDLKKQGAYLAALAKEKGLEDFLAGSHDGPVLFHHQFKIAAAGCPNGCSQPQIADFAIIGQSKPLRTEEPCTQCGLCVQACKEEALHLDEDGPVFNWDLCMRCGDCTRYCAQEAIIDGPTVYQVLIGGKLGRHPHLAVPVGDQVSWTEVEALFKAAIAFYQREALDGERFANLVQRLGAQAVQSALN